MKKELITLKCGVKALKTINCGYEYLSIDITDMFRGYGELSSMELLSKLFTELNESDFKKSEGVHMDIGCYDSVDAVWLEINRKIKK